MCGHERDDKNTGNWDKLKESFARPERKVLNYA
jgi:hypothetical protein